MKSTQWNFSSLNIIFQLIQKIVYRITCDIYRTYRKTNDTISKISCLVILPSSWLLIVPMPENLVKVHLVGFSDHISPQFDAQKFKPLLLSDLADCF